MLGREVRNQRDDDNSGDDERQSTPGGIILRHRVLRFLLVFRRHIAVCFLVFWLIRALGITGCHEFLFPLLFLYSADCSRFPRIFGPETEEAQVPGIIIPS